MAHRRHRDPHRTGVLSAGPARSRPAARARREALQERCVQRDRPRGETAPHPNPSPRWRGARGSNGAAGAGALRAARPAPRQRNIRREPLSRLRVRWDMPAHGPAHRTPARVARAGTRGRGEGGSAASSALTPTPLPADARRGARAARQVEERCVQRDPGCFSPRPSAARGRRNRGSTAPRTASGRSQTRRPSPARERPRSRRAAPGAP